MGYRSNCSRREHNVHCDSCRSEQLGEAGYCSSCGTSPHPFHGILQLASPIRWDEVRRALNRTAIGIVAIVGLLIIVAGLSHVPGSVRAAAEPATPTPAQAKIEAQRVSLDELFRDNEQRIRDAVEISGKAVPSEERLLHNLPPIKVQEEPLAY